MNVFKELTEIHEAICRASDIQDHLLDHYDPNNKKYDELLKELSSIKIEFEELNKAAEALSKRGEH